MRIRAGNASVKKKKKDPDLGQTTQNSIKISSLRCFPVQVRHFHTSDLFNDSVVGFCFDGRTTAPRSDFRPMG